MPRTQTLALEEVVKEAVGPLTRAQVAECTILFDSGGLTLPPITMRRTAPAGYELVVGGTQLLAFEAPTEESLIRQVFNCLSRQPFSQSLGGVHGRISFAASEHLHLAEQRFMIHAA